MLVGVGTGVGTGGATDGGKASLHHVHEYDIIYGIRPNESETVISRIHTNDA